MRRARLGFTVLEVLVAMLVLGIGIVALIGSSALVSRMIGQGRRTTHAVQVAERRLELLRQQAVTTVPLCAGLAGGSASQPGGITEQWQVVPSGATTLLRVVVTYPSGRGWSVDTLATAIACV